MKAFVINGKLIGSLTEISDPDLGDESRYFS